MKLVHSLLYALLFCSLLGSCQETSAPPRIPTLLLQVNVEDSVSQEVVISLQSSVNTFELDTIILDEQRQFAYEAFADSVMQINIKTSSVQSSFYVAPKDTLTITLTDSTLTLQGESLKYAQMSMNEFAKLRKDSLTTYPQLIRNQVKIYNELRNKLVIGKIVPYAIFKDTDEVGINSLERTGNAKVYTFWSLFDSTSIKNVIALNQTITALKGKGVDFISVCLENNDSIWKSTVDELELKGTQTRANANFSDSYLQRLNVQTLPYSFVLDTFNIVQRIGIYGDSLNTYLKQTYKHSYKKKKTKKKTVAKPARKSPVKPLVNSKSPYPVNPKGGGFKVTSTDLKK